MKQIDKQEIINNPEKYIKWMCYDILISIDNQVFNLSYRKLKMQLIGGSYCFYCNKRYRSTSWIRNNCINILGFVTN